MEGIDRNMTSRSEGQGQEGSGAAQALERDAGASPDSQTQATPFSQQISDVKPLTERPFIDQACCDFGVMTVSLLFLRRLGFYILIVTTA